MTLFVKAKGPQQNKIEPTGVPIRVRIFGVWGLGWDQDSLDAKLKKTVLGHGVLLGEASKYSKKKCSS